MLVDSRNKVLLIGPTPPPYAGMEVITQTLLESEISKLFRMLHLDISDRRSSDNKGRLDFINVYLALSHSLKLLWILIKQKPDLIHFQIAQNNLGYLRDSVFILLARIFRKRYLIHLHGASFRKFYLSTNVFMRYLIRLTVKRATCAVVLGHKLTSIFEHFVPKDKIAVVPNGVDFGPYDERAGLIKPIRGRPPFKILFLGTLIQSKGFVDLIKAASIILDKRTDVQFIIAGPEYRMDMEEAVNLVNTDGIKDFVVFSGIVAGQEKIDLLLMCDIFVFPTFYPEEGQPIVILEAMAAGLPVISTPHGCIDETVIHNETGFIVQARNIREIAERILQLLEDDVLRRKMGEAGRQRFLRYYTTQKFSANVQDVYKKALAKDTVRGK